MNSSNSQNAPQNNGPNLQDNIILIYLNEKFEILFQKLDALTLSLSQSIENGYSKIENLIKAKLNVSPNTNQINIISDYNNIEEMEFNSSSSNKNKKDNVTEYTNYYKNKENSIVNFNPDKIKEKLANENSFVFYKQKVGDISNKDNSNPEIQLNNIITQKESPKESQKGSQIENPKEDSKESKTEKNSINDSNSNTLANVENSLGENIIPKKVNVDENQKLMNRFTTLIKGNRHPLQKKKNGNVVKRKKLNLNLEITDKSLTKKNIIDSKTNNDEKKI